MRWLLLRDWGDLLLVASATTVRDARDFFAAAGEDGVVLGVGFGGLLFVLTREVLVDGVVEGTAQGLSYALYNALVFAFYRWGERGGQVVSHT